MKFLRSKKSFRSDGETSGEAEERQHLRETAVPQVRSVCLTLGPYRNLTTLTASILFLHPRCQVLNHAGGEILGVRDFDFLLHPDTETLANFVARAIQLSRHGVRGQAGGSITASHAFGEGHEMGRLYAESGLPAVKPTIECVVWKESLVVANYLREHQVEVGALLDALPPLRFLQPVRNPLDCAVSSLKQKYKLFRGLPANPSVEQVLEAILEEYAWFASLERERPGRFFAFYEYDFTAVVLRNLADFLDLEADDEWIGRACRAFQLKPGYEHPPDRVDFYRRRVGEIFATAPHWRERLLRFVAD
jgi:hypothetical protein